jgi:hypothetical protein
MNMVTAKNTKRVFETAICLVALLLIVQTAEAARDRDSSSRSSDKSQNARAVASAPQQDAGSTRAAQRDVRASSGSAKVNRTEKTQASSKAEQADCSCGQKF